MNDEEIEVLSFVLASKWRIKLILLLFNKIYTPSIITNKLDIPIYKVSRLLAELRDHGLVECMNPTSKKGRMYKLTNKGENIVNTLEKITKE